MADQMGGCITMKSSFLHPIGFMIGGLLIGVCATVLHAESDDGVYRLTLENAVRYQPVNIGKDEDHDPIAIDLTLDLVREDGQWQEAVWGWSPQQPGLEHLGRLRKSEKTDSGWQLEIDLTITHQRQRPMVLGGQIRYQIGIDATDDAKWNGRYTGQSRASNTPEIRYELERAWGLGYMPGGPEWGHLLVARLMKLHLASGDLSGKISGTLDATGSLAAAHRLDIEPGEHPRLLFKEKDLPELRRRAATPHGRQILDDLKEMLENAETHGFGYHAPTSEHSMQPSFAAGWGMLYQLTGKAEYAEKAFSMLDGPMFGNYYYGGGWLHPYSLTGIALTYDLCYHAWTPGQRDLVQAYLRDNIADLAWTELDSELRGGGGRYVFANRQDDFRFQSPEDGQAIKFRAAAAFAALAILHDPPALERPKQLTAIPTIEPVDDRPWIGVPVVDYESDIMPRRWLMAGPFRRGTQDELMKQAGGFAKTNPEPGQVITIDDVETEWRQYLPNNHNAPDGPAIYARNCSRYWASGTGGGYLPGISLMDKWRSEQVRRDLPINVTLFTIIRNDHTRIVQAMPNWRSPSIGSRMWLNGHQVTDGQLVRIKPGLYRLVVDVAVLGGYSGQSPKLKDYTPVDLDLDHRRATKLAKHASATDVFDDPLMRDLISLQRSIRRYTENAISTDGWGGWETHDSLLPFLTVYQRLTGSNLATNTGLNRWFEIALLMDGASMSMNPHWVISQMTALLDERERRIARWYFDQHGHGSRRPLDHVLALVTHPIDDEPLSPAGQYPLARLDVKAGIALMASAWPDSARVTTLLRLGTEAAPMSGGHLAVSGFGQSWLRDVSPSGQFSDQLDLGRFYMRGLFPTRPPKLLHHKFDDDGSARFILSYETDALAIGEIYQDQNGRQRLLLDAPPDPPVSHIRHVAIDYSGQSGHPILLVTVDHVTQAGTREKVWRAAMPSSPLRQVNAQRPVFQHGINPEQEHHRFTLVARDGEHHWRTTIIAPRPVVFEYDRDREGRVVGIRALVDRHLKEREKASRDRFDQLAREVAAGIKSDPVRVLTPDRQSPELFVNEDPVLRELVREFDQVQEAQRQKQLPPTTIMTISTLSSGEPPVLQNIETGQNPAATIGSMRIHYDGKKIHLERVVED